LAAGGPTTDLIEYGVGLGPAGLGDGSVVGPWAPALALTVGSGVGVSAGATVGEAGDGGGVDPGVASELGSMLGSSDGVAPIDGWSDELSPGAATATGPGGCGWSGTRPNHTAPPATARPRTTSDRRSGRLRVAWERTVARTIPRSRRGYHPPVTQPPAIDGPQLLRSVGLLADGPGRWGRPIAAQGPGVFVVELVAPLATPPIELTRVGKWVERVETLRLDGERPTSKALASRLASFWLPAQTVLYIGSSDASIGRRAMAMAHTELGDRRPQSSGHWLKVLRGLETARIWWSATTATEEYEDALFDAFAEHIATDEQAGLPDQNVVLPFANLRRGDGRRKATGLTGSLIAEPAMVPAPPTTIVQLPDGDAEGARGEPPPPKRRAATRRVARPAAEGAVGVTGAAADSPHALAAGIEGLTVEGAARLQAELEHLTTVKRREVVARIRTAKEHGDLKENAEYHAAREEQSFLEGRVQAIEARLRTAVVVNAPESGARVGLGSRVTVEIEGETIDYTIVGASESDPTAGRISSSSPVGRALVGRDIGDVIAVTTPAGPREYRIVQIN
jgi:transcription elongation factor GreA